MAAAARRGSAFRTNGAAGAHVAANPTLAPGMHLRWHRSTRRVSGMYPRRTTWSPYQVIGGRLFSESLPHDPLCAPAPYCGIGIKAHFAEDRYRGRRIVLAGDACCWPRPPGLILPHPLICSRGDRRTDLTLRGSGRRRGAASYRFPHMFSNGCGKPLRPPTVWNSCGIFAAQSRRPRSAISARLHQRGPFSSLLRTSPDIGAPVSIRGAGRAHNARYPSAIPPATGFRHREVQPLPQSVPGRPA